MSWTCQRVAGGEKCGQHHEDNRKRNCIACGKPRPPKRKPAHMAALDLGYEHYLRLNGGAEECALCGAGPKMRRLQRDHDHRTGEPRGLLCARCNRALPAWVTPEWLLRAATYIRQSP